MSRQVLLSGEQLNLGLAVPGEESIPGEHVAEIALEPADFVRRSGLQFQDSFDNLDYLKVALLELVSGERFALVRYGGAPAGGMELFVTKQDWANSDVVTKILEALPVEPHEVRWRRPWPMWGWGYGEHPGASAEGDDTR